MYEWGKMSFRDLTLGTLRHLAKIDSPKEYAVMKKEDVELHVTNSLNGSHWEVTLQMDFHKKVDQMETLTGTKMKWLQEETACNIINKL